MQIRAIHRVGLLPQGKPASSRSRREAGLTMVELLVALIIVAVVFGAIINGYMAGAKKAQWSCYSLAAQSLSLHVLEQTRSAKWDTTGTEITNLTLMNKSFTSSSGATNWVMTGYTTNILDIPWNVGNPLLATNYITIQCFNQNNLAGAPTVLMQFVRVDSVWPFNGWGNFSLNYYTSSVCTLLGPDNRDPSTLGL